MGAGQACLQLGFALLRDDHEVTLFSENSADEILSGRVTAVPIQFYPSYGYEEALDLILWDADKAIETGAVLNIITPDDEVRISMNLVFRTGEAAHAIDPRYKFSKWLNEFARRGGDVQVKKVDINLLEHCTQHFDMTIVGTGKGELSKIFQVEPDSDRNPYSTPQRKLLAFCVEGCKLPVPDYGFYNILVADGEFIIWNYLGKDDQRHHYVLFEIKPGSTADIFDGLSTGQELFDLCKHFIRTHYPKLYPVIQSASLVSDAEWLKGAVTPVVRKPVAYLPSGRYVMGIGDAVLLNDPIMAQGLNNASKMAKFIHTKLSECKADTIDDTWMKNVFDQYWETAKYHHMISNTMLDGLSPHQQKVMAIAATNAQVAEDLAVGLGDASTIQWFFDKDETEKYLSGIVGVYIK